MSNLKVLVAQKGAREHFLAARALHQRGILAGLVTDWYAFGRQNAGILKTEKLKPEKSQHLSVPAFQRLISGFSVSAFQHFGRQGQGALAARAEGIPDDLVHAMRLRSFWWKWRVRKAAQRGCLYDGYVETDAAFGRAVAGMNLPEHEAFFGYSYASLEMLVAEKQRGKLTILDQIDPGVMEFRLVAEEMARFPELAGPPPRFPAAHCRRNQQEWELADIIVVNSEWTREAIIAEGAEAGKIEVLPLAFETNAEMLKTETPKSNGISASQNVSVSDFSSLRVLFLGQVNVRKGIHYLMEAARLLEHEKVHFDVVGPIGILPGAVASAPPNLTFHGPVSRDRAAEWYQKADVFILPTLSDGFAITQLEAMSHGLPVIVTPNCGQVVKDNVTGNVVPPRDSQALAEAILQFVRNPKLAAEMSPLCIEASRAFSIESYGTKLVGIIEKHSGKR